MSILYKFKTVSVASFYGYVILFHEDRIQTREPTGKHFMKEITDTLIYQHEDDSF